MAVVSFVNMKGGVGKTTICVNIAYTLATRFNKNVLVIDLDPQFNATQCFISGMDYIEFREKGKRTIVEIFSEEEQMIPDLITGNRKAHPPVKPEDVIIEYTDNLHILLGDLDLYRLEFSQGMAREKKLARFLADEGLYDKYDYILIDCPPTPSIWMISGLLASNSYIIPMKPEPLSRYGLDLFGGIVNRVVSNHGHEMASAGIILTMTEQNTLVYRETVDFLNSNERWRDKVFRYELLKRTAIANSQAEQQFMQNINDELQQMIVQLTQEFIRRV